MYALLGRLLTRDRNSGTEILDRRKEATRFYILNFLQGLETISRLHRDTIRVRTCTFFCK